MNPPAIAAAVFYAALALILYVYVLFPLVLLVRGSLIRRPNRQSDITPSLSLIIVAHNEADSIGAKLENVLSQDYPPDRMNIVVASDGSDDGTDEVVRRYASRGVTLLACPRRGKIPALNAAVERAGGELLVFSDANSMLCPDALRRLAGHFADPAVGGVAGNQCYTRDNGHAAGSGERLYWSFDRWLKSLQSRSGNVIAATGALYAIRRSVFRPVPSGVGDDFVISTRVIEQGYRLVFDPEAQAFEPTASSDRAEFRRKVRVIVRGLRGLWAVRRLFNPLRYGFYSVQILSHKLLRWCVGWLLLALFIANLALAVRGGIYGGLAVAQVLFYFLAAAVPLARQWAGVRVPRLLSIPYYFCLVNWAAICAWVKVAAGARLDVWDSQRPTQAPVDAKSGLAYAGAPATGLKRERQHA